VIAQFRARLDLSNRSVAIVDRDGDPLYAYGSDLACSNAAETLLRAAWTNLD
jgi:hypothetical protein